MGIYAINCPHCNKAFQWWSGNISQLCEDCSKPPMHSLYLQGFIPIKDLEYPQYLVDFVFNLANYKEAPLDNRINCYETPDLPESITKYLNKRFYGFKPKKWMARNVGKGFTILPHVEHIMDNYHNGSPLDTINSPATICLYLSSSDNFIGRNFVYGKVKDEPLYRQHHIETFPYGVWDDPNLEVIGTIKPLTGMGVVIDRTNPIFWHGVTELISDVRIVSLLGVL